MMKRSIKKLAIVGAGIASCGLVKAVGETSVQIEVFEKARGVGGRMSNMRTKNGSIELGAQFMTTYQRPFCEQIQQWQQQHLIAPAHELPLLGLIQAPAWVAQQSFSTALRQLLKHTKLHLATRVTQISPNQGKLYTQEPNTNPGASNPTAINTATTGTTEKLSWGPYDHIVISTPAPQALALLTQVEPAFASLTHVQYWPSWVMVAHSQGPVPHYVEYSEDFHWIQFKPATTQSTIGTAANPLVVIQMSPQWSEQQVDQEASRVTALIQQCASNIGLPPFTPLRCHRWLYAQPKTALTQPFLTSDTVSYIGDACLDDAGLSGHVESAFMSGYSLGKHWLQHQYL